MFGDPELAVTGVWEGWAASSHVSNSFQHAHAVENRPKRRDSVPTCTTGDRAHSSASQNSSPSISLTELEFLDGDELDVYINGSGALA
ncbi:hypothetical protein L914_20226 [Phytophthora nicotianae]|uniref:Uncharacterized protein n=1 Tax=Phytophthora nicotianae TaxID=4792 RepID=W2M9U1_PHYNI|nr:hypothetical protein L914_20226 [Phytophthora nicotianae]